MKAPRRDLQTQRTSGLEDETPSVFSVVVVGKRGCAAQKVERENT